MQLEIITAAAAAKSLQSCPTLCDPIDTAHQAPPSLGFSRQEHWSGLPFPSPCMKVKSESKVAQSCPTLSDPMDCSLPSYSVHGIFQARVLEWGAIAFSVLILIFHCLCICESESRSVVSDSSVPHGPQPTRLLHPWDFPGKSTGVGCHCLTTSNLP